MKAAAPIAASVTRAYLQQTVGKLDATLSAARGERNFAIFSTLLAHRPRNSGCA